MSAKPKSTRTARKAPSPSPVAQIHEVSIRLRYMVRDEMQADLVTAAIDQALDVGAVQDPLNEYLAARGLPKLDDASIVGVVVKRGQRKLPILEYTRFWAPPETVTIGPKCNCPVNQRGGFWVFFFDNQWLAFSPRTQMQKDAWLAAARNESECKARESKLRWYCTSCETVQTP